MMRAAPVVFSMIRTWSASSDEPITSTRCGSSSGTSDVK